MLNQWSVQRNLICTGELLCEKHDHAYFAVTNLLYYSLIKSTKEVNVYLYLAQIRTLARILFHYLPVPLLMSSVCVCPCMLRVCACCKSKNVCV
jgi:hypothetical protein